MLQTPHSPNIPYSLFLLSEYFDSLTMDFVKFLTHRHTSLLTAFKVQIFLQDPGPHLSSFPSLTSQAVPLFSVKSVRSISLSQEHDQLCCINCIYAPMAAALDCIILYYLYLYLAYVGLEDIKSSNWLWTIRNYNFSLLNYYFPHFLKSIVDFVLLCKRTDFTLYLVLVNVAFWTILHSL